MANRSHIPGGGPICTAQKKNGQPCKMHEVPGTGKCYLHGGASPAAKLKSEMALALLRFPAIEVLQNVLETLNKIIEQFMDDTCMACGYPKGDAEEKEALIKACRSAAQTCSAILDRTGLGPRATLEVKQSDGDLPLNSLTTDERERMMFLLAQMKELKGEIRQRLTAAPDAATPQQIM